MMSTPDDDPKTKSDVSIEVFKIANRLKAKLGRKPNDEPGYIDPEAIEEADQLIETLCEECSSTLSGHIKELSDIWKEAKDLKQSREREKLSREMFTIAHEIKDLGSMCGYVLIAHFAESLRDYIDRAEINLDAQRVIVKAHLDAMQTANKQDLKDDGGPMAEELKALVKVAIDKYS